MPAARPSLLTAARHPWLAALLGTHLWALGLLVPALIARRAPTIALLVPPPVLLVAGLLRNHPSRGLLGDLALLLAFPLATLLPLAAPELRPHAPPSLLLAAALAAYLLAALALGGDERPAAWSREHAVAPALPWRRWRRVEVGTAGLALALPLPLIALGCPRVASSGLLGAATTLGCLALVLGLVAPLRRHVDRLGRPPLPGRERSPGAVWAPLAGTLAAAGVALLSLALHAVARHRLGLAAPGAGAGLLALLLAGRAAARSLVTEPAERSP